MLERDKHLEQFRNLTLFIKLIMQGFEHFAKVREYIDERFKNLED